MKSKVIYLLLAVLFCITTGMAYQTTERNPIVQTSPLLTTFETFTHHLNRLYQREKDLSEQDCQSILKAAQFAAEKSPQNPHSLRVASHLLTVEKVTDKDIIIAALVHPVVQCQEVEALFGPKVACLLQEVAKDSRAPAHIQNEQQILKASSLSHPAARLVLAEKFEHLNAVTIEGSLERDQSVRYTKALIDNLPEIKSPLKKAADCLITHYWQSRVR